MVKHLFYFLCFWWMAMGMLEAAPFVDASIDSMSSQAHFPLQGTITITHAKEEKIDPQSFTLEGKHLETSLVKNVNISGDTWVSIYSFELPAQEKGLYILPAISIKIGSQTYQTTPSTYEVKSEATSPPAVSSTNTPSSPLIFRLEAAIQGPSSLYPGERTKLFYRISFNRSVDLTRSVLPMVHPDHFQKIGDVQVKDYQTKDVTVQELTQEIEASDLGTFQLGPSFIEGYAYSMQAGQKVYSSDLLKAEAPAVTIEVKPFPHIQQPPSFTGALGKIAAEATLQSSHSVSIGENIQVQVKVQGITNLTELRLPILQCQPGFSGFFQMSDLPPLAEIKNDVKFFQIELRPLTSLIKQIPSIEVSSFDPSTGKYVVQHTSPLSLTVETHSKEESSLNSTVTLARLPVINKWPTPIIYPLEIEIDPIQIQDIKAYWVKSHWIFWIIPLGIILLVLQKYWHDQLQKRPKPLIAKSERLFQRALKAQFAKAPGSLNLLEQAFWHRLWEKGIIPYNHFELDRLIQENKFEPIYSFLLQLQALQYSSDKSYDPEKIQHNAQQLFQSI